MQGRNAQVARIYRILNLLEGSPQGLSAAEIKARLSERDFDVSKRTIYRDLEALCEAGFPVFPTETTSDENATRWVLEGRTKVGQYLAFSIQELFALHLVRGMLAQLKDTPVHTDFERAFQKIEDKLGTSHREYLDELSMGVRFDQSTSWAQGLDADTLETVRAACAEGQVLSTDYESVNSGTVKRRRLGPHYLYFAKGSVYLVAEDLETAKTKLFALPRMKNVVMEDEPFESTPIDHERFFKSSFGIFQGSEPKEVEIEFGKTVASFVRERRWHSSQRVKELDSGRILVSMSVAVTPELVQWVLGFGPEAQVLEPKDLRDQVVSAVAEMAKYYACAQAAG